MLLNKHKEIGMKQSRITESNKIEEHRKNLLCFHYNKVKKELTNYEKFFKQNVLDECVAKNEYSIDDQIGYKLELKGEKSRNIIYDFSLKYKDQVFLIELDDGSHNKVYKDEDSDLLKDATAIRFGFKLIRMKASVYMYGVNKDINSYEPKFIEPYGKNLMKLHLKKCIELLQKIEVTTNKGIVLYCPDGDPYKYYSAGNYRAGLLNFAKDFKVTFSDLS